MSRRPSADRNGLRKRRSVAGCNWQVKNTGYPKKPGLVKGNMSPKTCGLQGVGIFLTHGQLLFSSFFFRRSPRSLVFWPRGGPFQRSVGVQMTNIYSQPHTAWMTQETKRGKRGGGESSVVLSVFECNFLDFLRLRKSGLKRCGWMWMWGRGGAVWLSLVGFG